MNRRTFFAKAASAAPAALLAAPTAARASQFDALKHGTPLKPIVRKPEVIAWNAPIQDVIDIDHWKFDKNRKWFTRDNVDRDYSLSWRMYKVHGLPEGYRLAADKYHEVPGATILSSDWDGTRTHDRSQSHQPLAAFVGPGGRVEWTGMIAIPAVHNILFSMPLPMIFSSDESLRLGEPDFIPTGGEILLFLERV